MILQAVGDRISGRNESPFQSLKPLQRPNFHFETAPTLYGFKSGDFHFEGGGSITLKITSAAIVSFRDGLFRGGRSVIYQDLTTVVNFLTPVTESDHSSHGLWVLIELIIDAFFRLVVNLLLR